MQPSSTIRTISATASRQIQVRACDSLRDSDSREVVVMRTGGEEAGYRENWALRLEYPHLLDDGYSDSDEAPWS